MTFDLDPLKQSLLKAQHALANAQDWYISDPEDSEMDRDQQIGNWIERALDDVKNAITILDTHGESND